jgi:hypothetical protein
MIRVQRVLGAVLLAACGPPTLTGLVPSSGPPRTLVETQGNASLATVVWDAGAGGETLLPGLFYNARYFSVPSAAAVGAHDVALERDATRTATAVFTVTGDPSIPGPRLDRVSLAGSEFDGAGNVNCWLTVAGANVDVGAEVIIDGVAQATVTYMVMPNELYGIDAASLGYPIGHYAALLSWTGNRPVGSSIAVRVRNLDGVESATLNYTLPVDAATMDSDGDDIPDEWEENGYDADGNGTIDVDLPGLGASAFVPDVLLEIDTMLTLDFPPTPATFDAMVASFAASPVISAGGFGINLILDTGGSVPYWDEIDLDAVDDPLAGSANFYTLKTANFDEANRGRLYHYCIWGNMRPSGSSGVSDVVFGSGGDDCIVAFDDFPIEYQTDRSGAETLMHEFGHNLDQQHGGTDGYAYKPTYSSVMSYPWQFRTADSDTKRLSEPICAPLYYQLTDAVEVAGALPVGFALGVNYSHGMVRNLVESALDEPAGVCDGVGVDWNGDGDTTDFGVAADLNNDGDTTDTLADFANWALLKFIGPRTNGSG